MSRLIIDREKSHEFEEQRFRDDSTGMTIGSSKYDFYTYGSYAEMVAWMHSLARKYQNIVQFISVGKTHEGRSIDGLEVSSICFVLFQF